MSITGPAHSLVNRYRFSRTRTRPIRISPVGWDYAEKLAEFVLERRAETHLEERGLDPQTADWSYVPAVLNN